MSEMPSKATRDGFGEGIVELGRRDPRVVVLSGDLGDSTRAELFQQAFPTRFIEMGIAEQDMVGTAAGLALAGKIPFVCSFSAFLTGRAWEQIRIAVCYQRANVKLVGSHSGLSPAMDGATAISLEELATMRVLPGMTVVVPCDAVEAKKATLAMADHPGPVFLRTGRNPIPILTQAEEPFAIGRAVVRQPGTDVTLVACGTMVRCAEAAHQLLAGRKIRARVINLHTIKPLDRETLLAAARETGAVVTAEEHSLVGGMGSAVAELLAQEAPVPMRILGTPDTFGKSGTPEELLAAFRLTPEAMAEAACDVIRQKSRR